MILFFSFYMLIVTSQLGIRQNSDPARLNMHLIFNLSKMDILLQETENLAVKLKFEKWISK